MSIESIEDLPVNYLPAFTPSESLFSDIKTIETAKMMGWASTKGNFDINYRKAGFIMTINGVEYYRNIRLTGWFKAWHIKGTRAYYLAEAWRMMGFEDADFHQLAKDADSKGVSYLYQIWRYKQVRDRGMFERGVEALSSGLIGVKKLEIDYILERYKEVAYPTAAERNYHPKNLLYGDELPSATQFAEAIGTATPEALWDTTDPDRHKKRITYANGISGTIKVYDEYSQEIALPELFKNAILTMIAYSGDTFMEMTSSKKVSESRDAYGYVVVTGRETYIGALTNSFETDDDKHHWRRYAESGSFFNGSTKGAIGTHFTSFNTGDPDEWRGSPDSGTFSAAFWEFAIDFEISNNQNVCTLPKNSRFDKNIACQGIPGGQAYYFGTPTSFNQKHGGGLQLKRKEFLKMRREDFRPYIAGYWDIKVKKKKISGWKKTMGKVLNVLGKIFDFVYDIFAAIPLLKLQLDTLTKVVNAIFGSDMTAKEMFKLTLQIVVSIIVIVVSWGAATPALAAFWASYGLMISIGLSLSIAGSDANDAKRKAKLDAKRNKENKRMSDKLKEQELLEDKLQEEFDMGEGKGGTQEEFMAHLQNPLYQNKAQDNQLEITIESQFHVI